MIGTEQHNRNGRSVEATAGAIANVRADQTPRELSPLAKMIASEPVPPAMSAVVLGGSIRIVEFLLLSLIGFAIYATYVYPDEGFLWRYVIATFGTSGAAILAFQLAEAYDVAALRRAISTFARLTLAWTAIFLVAFAFQFFFRLEGQFSRVWTASWYFTGLTALFAFRIFIVAKVRQWTREGRLIRRTVIVGGAAPGEALIEALQAQTDSDLDIRGVFDDRGDERSAPMIAGKPKLGTVDDLVEFARRTRIDLLLVSLPITAEQRVLQMLRKLWVLPVDIRLAAHMSKLRFRPRAYSYIGNVPVLDIYDRPITDWNIVLKWLFDKTVGTLMLIALSPVMLLTALAVKLDSKGPVFFKQKRYGFNNELIEVFKFRSMYTDMTDANAAKLVTKGDPRVTRVGRFIRKTSLDELPQLINVVFKGNLSLVGPRPHAVHAKAQNRLYDEVVDGYFARHRVKPGITGWAQVNGWRGETDTPEKIQRRVEHDLYYIENWSVFLDLYILLKTPVSLLKTENAY
ncbi:MAG: undecaprenyl-phosphate glucose phosphotransferase [Xanthobacteraceae bacterium]|nr:undecaprenyl-phosphate glucose phosphotransferase [Xanthobacteraceae bacterium]